MLNEEYLINAISGVEDGTHEPLLVYAEIKKALDVLTKAEKQVKEQAIDDSAQYDKTFELHGFKFERRNGARYYEYKHDEKWNEISAHKKQREDLMKQALQGAEVYDGDGEIIPPAIEKFRGDSLIVK